VLAVRRTPVYDPFDDHDDPSHDPGPPVRRINSTPGAERQARRGEVRTLNATRRPPPRRGPDPRVWFVRGSIGIAAMAGLWLGLQALFPVSESRVSQSPAPTQPADVSAVGAPEPPAAPPAAQQPAAAPPAAQEQPAAPPVAQQQPVPTPVSQAAPTPEGDRLPGLPTPGGAAQAAPPAAAPAAPEAPPAQQPAAEAKPQDEAPSQQPVGTPTLEPIPPPPAAQASGAVAPRPAPAAPAPKPQAPPPVAASGGGSFDLSASASPVNPISEQANVTITVRATQGGAPVSGATCMATIHYRTATAKQPDGGFRTNANGVGSFTLDARNTTYGYYIPVDVTCTGRGGSSTTRTGFTPVKGR
jgi:hypothetical protein